MQKEKEMAELKEDLASVKEKFIEVEKVLDCQEQYSRRNCLLVHGVDENNNRHGSSNHQQYKKSYGRGNYYS